MPNLPYPEEPDLTFNPNFYVAKTKKKVLSTPVDNESQPNIHRLLAVTLVLVIEAILLLCLQTKGVVKS